jgi:tripeptide aminopeptidase
VLEGGVDRTSVKFLIRDFATARLQEKEAFLEDLARRTAADWPGASVRVEVRASYRNMKEILDRHPQVVENAREAIRRAGLEPREGSIRGGTDGSQLSYMGLPTANLFAGQHNFHSRLEWVAGQDLEKASETIVHLVQVWEERA